MILDQLKRRPTMAAFAVFAVIGLLTSGDVPWSDDARFYVPAAASYARWFERVVTFDLDAWSAASINAAFSQNAEHPPVGKYIMGAGWLVFHHWTGVTDDITACRIGVTLLWALMCAVVFAMTRRQLSVWCAVVAAGGLATMPRLLYHAHAETLDLPVAALCLMTCAALFSCLEQPSWRDGAITVVLFALALGTKLNAPFILVAALIYLATMSPPHVVQRRIRLPAVPLVILGMIIVSPLITWLLWPWMWFDTIDRLQTYAQFHLQHYGIYFYYGGVLYDESVAPWTAPWVMLALTLPITLLLLALLGGARPLWTIVGQLPGIWKRDLTTGAGLSTDPTLRFGVFIALQAAMQLLAASLPGVPKYGGIKLFLPALPFITMLCARGFHTIEHELAPHQSSLPVKSLLGLAVVATLLPGTAGAFAYRGAWLSHYNALAGGVAGATESGYERQYYDLAYPEIPAAVERLLPEGGTIAVLPNPKEYTPHFGRWQRLGIMSHNIRLAPPERADLLLLTHERRWAHYADLVSRYGRTPAAHRHSVYGIPMFSIYRLTR